jgi:hypothetical protein
MAGYKLATYESGHGPRAGAVVNDVVYDVTVLTGQPRYGTVLDVLNDWEHAHKLLDAASKSAKGEGGRCNRRNFWRRCVGLAPSIVQAQTIATTSPKCSEPLTAHQNRTRTSSD